MSKADQIFVSNANEIIQHGTNTFDENVRAIWPDTKEKAYTIKKFGVCNFYDLREEFPALTLRKTGIKSAIAEVLWIFQKKSNNIKDLTLHGKPIHIWDEWAGEDGSIGRAYGYQIGHQMIHEAGQWYDQMDYVLHQLRTTPFSRRILTTIYKQEELHLMNLAPCCWNLTFNVTDEGYDKLVLNMVLNQRSNDMLAANNWNVVQYSALLMMVAQVSNMIPGKLMHVIVDHHIYDRHIKIVSDLIQREQFAAPIVTLNDTITNFYNFTPDSFVIENYQAGEQIKNIPIAI